jgi:hypothetical protein
MKTVSQSKHWFGVVPLSWNLHEAWMELGGMINGFRRYPYVASRTWQVGSVSRRIKGLNKEYYMVMAAD